jgi:hypothetical protein
MRCPASFRLSIASSRTVSSSAMKRVYEQASPDHPIVSPSPASSPTRPERSRAVSLVTSFGSCGPIYEPPNMRRHQDRGSEGFRGLFSRPEGVSLRIGSVGVSRSAASRTGVRPGKLGRELRNFSKAFRRRSESSVVRTRVRSICSRWCSICHSRLSM